MTCIILKDSSAKTRGIISRFLIEVFPSVFIGNVSKTVRENIWSYIISSKEQSLMAWSVNNDIGYETVSTETFKNNFIKLENFS